MLASQQSKALSLDQFVALLERKSVIPGVLSLDEVSRIPTILMQDPDAFLFFGACIALRLIFIVDEGETTIL